MHDSSSAFCSYDYDIKHEFYPNIIKVDFWEDQLFFPPSVSFRVHQMILFDFREVTYTWK